MSKTTFDMRELNVHEKLAQPTCASNEANDNALSLPINGFTPRHDSYAVPTRKPCTALDVARGELRYRRLFAVDIRQRHVALRLIRPLGIVVFEVYLHQTSQMTLPADDDVREEK